MPMEWHLSCKICGKWLQAKGLVTCQKWTNKFGKS